MPDPLTGQPGPFDLFDVACRWCDMRGLFAAPVLREEWRRVGGDLGPLEELVSRGVADGGPNTRQCWQQRGSGGLRAESVDKGGGLRETRLEMAPRNARKAQVLGVLLQEGSITSGELVRKWGVVHSTASTLLELYRHHGLVSRAREPGPGPPVYRYRITPTGVKKAQWFMRQALLHAQGQRHLPGLEPEELPERIRPVLRDERLRPNLRE